MTVKLVAVTQWAAVRTYLEATRLPPQTSLALMLWPSRFIPLNSFIKIAAIQGYLLGWNRTINFYANLRQVS